MENLSFAIAKGFRSSNVFIDLPTQIVPEDLKTLVHREGVIIDHWKKFTDYLNLALHLLMLPRKLVQSHEATDGG